MGAVIPSLGRTKVPGEQANWLFFANFTQLDEDVFVERILPELADDERLFRMMLRDMYQNGLVLQRKKYRLLGWAYRVFIIGLVLTLITFICEQLVPRSI